MVIKNIIVGLLFSGLAMGADSDVKALYGAILHNDLTRLERLINNPGADINHQLTVAESSSGVKRLEPGMTPLLYALSIERLEAAKLMLKKAANLDVNLKNMHGVDSMLMLIMVEVGDERYDKSGDEELYKMRYKMQHKKSPPGAFLPVIKAEKLIEIFDLLVEKGFTNFSDFYDTAHPASPRNYITEALVHGKLYLADKLAKRKAEIPGIKQTLSLRTYFTSGDLEERERRYEEFINFMGNYDITDQVKQWAFGPGLAKEHIQDFGFADEKTIEKLNGFLKKLLAINPDMSDKDFNGFLEGIGSNLHESTKVILRGKDK